MLSLRSIAPGVLALLGLAVTVGSPRTALAAANMTIQSKVSFGTDQLFDELTIEAGGALLVTPVAGGGQGKIHIRARKILIKAGGKISASGVGYPGANAKDGNAAPISGGGGKISTLPGEPGGGGGYFGAGASGADAACMSLPNAGGGAMGAMPTPEAPILGSAGGAANVTSSASAGGDGGGAILLEAASIQIDGSIEADGGSPMMAAGGVAQGGGSGGFISIIAAHLAGGGTLSAHGGAGLAAPGVPLKIPANHGGGGAGGVIYLKAREDASSLTTNTQGGATGSCPTLGAADGPTPQVIVDPAYCVDADQDGAFSDACGGDDCNDSDTLINPKGAEVCNGVDDDCDGATDEGADICPAGRACKATATATACVDISDAGSDAGPPVDAGAPPDHLAFESGCAIGDHGDPRGALTLAGLGLGALVWRRRRAPAEAAR